jgi:hypothetical protein
MGATVIHAGGRHDEENTRFSLPTMRMRQTTVSVASWTSRTSWTDCYFDSRSGYECMHRVLQCCIVLRRQKPCDQLNFRPNGTSKRPNPEKGGSEWDEVDNMVSRGLNWKRRTTTRLFSHKNTPIGRLLYYACITKAEQEWFVNYIKDSRWRKYEDEILCKEIPIADQPCHSEVSVTFLVFTIGERCTAVTRLFTWGYFTTYRRP